MTEGKSQYIPGFQPFPSSGRAETWLRHLQRGQEGLKCSWKPSTFFAVVHLNSICHVGFLAQLMMVMKAGGLRTECGSLAVLLHHHHNPCGLGDKEELLWRVWLQWDFCSSVLSGCLGAQVEKDNSLWQREGFTASPGKSRATHGHRDQMSLVGFGKSLSKEMLYWVVPTEIRLCLQIACRKTGGCSALPSDEQNPSEKSEV